MDNAKRKLREVLVNILTADTSADVWSKRYEIGTVPRIGPINGNHLKIPENQAFEIRRK